MPRDGEAIFRGSLIRKRFERLTGLKHCQCLSLLSKMLNNSVL